MKRVEEDMTQSLGPIVDELRRRLKDETEVFFGALFIGSRTKGFGFVFDDKMPAAARDELIADMQAALDAMRQRYSQ